MPACGIVAARDLLASCVAVVVVAVAMVGAAAAPTVNFFVSPRRFACALPTGSRASRVAASNGLYPLLSVFLGSGGTLLPHPLRPTRLDV